MLSTPDADLIRRDPALPGMAILLDTEAFAARLRPFLPDIGTIKSSYVRYKPGMSCLVTYRLEAAGAEMMLYAIAYRPNAQDKIQKASKPPCIFIEDCATVVSIYPKDSKLKVLPSLVDTQARERLLHKLFPYRPDLWKGTVQTLAYKPERRYVAGLLIEDNAKAVLKIYNNSSYDAANRSAKAFRPQQHLRLAQRIGRSKRHNIIAFEWHSGRLMGDEICDAAYEEVVTVGKALAELQAQNPKGLACLARKAEASNLLDVAAWVGFVCPGIALRVNKLSRRLADCIMHEPQVNKPIHGDFYAKQVLIEDDTAAILDLDKAVRSDPASDLGNFIAHLERDAICNNTSPCCVEHLKKALLEGYEIAAGETIPAGVELYTSAGLLKLMPEPFRNREPDWNERTEVILKRAEAILNADRGSIEHTRY